MSSRFGSLAIPRWTWFAVAAVFALGGLLVLTLGGWEVMEGRLTIGELVSMQLIAGLLLAPITQMVMLARTLQEGRPEVVLRRRVARRDPRRLPAQPHARRGVARRNGRGRRR